MEYHNEMNSVEVGWAKSHCIALYGLRDGFASFFDRVLTAVLWGLKLSFELKAVFTVTV